MNDDANTLPKLDKIRIPLEKFTQYALNPEKSKDKAVAFELALGYNLTNYRQLIANIAANVINFNATAKGNLGHGERYEVVMELVGANGKTADVLTAWIDDVNADEMRLTSAYVNNRKRRTNAD